MTLQFSGCVCGYAGSKRAPKLPPPLGAAGLADLDTLEGEQARPLASPFCAPATEPGASHAAGAPDPGQPKLPDLQQSSADRTCPASRPAGRPAGPEVSGSSGGGRGALGAHAAAHPGCEPTAWPRVPACVGSGGGSAHAAAANPGPDPDAAPKALEPGTPAGGRGGLGSPAGGHAANPGPDPEAWPKAPESVASVGGAGGLVEVVGACFPVVVALYCSGVYFVLAFPFFTYVPTSGAMGARMLPKARRTCSPFYTYTVYTICMYRGHRLHCLTTPARFMSSKSACDHVWMADPLPLAAPSCCARSSVMQTP